MSNETISKWLGECRHDWERIATSKDTLVAEFECICHERKAIPNDGDFPSYPTDYENDESAWTQELYGRIEEADIEGLFAHALMDITGCPTLDEEESTGEGGYIDHVSFITMAYIISKATPAQKAAALSRAITEAIT